MIIFAAQMNRQCDFDDWKRICYPGLQRIWKDPDEMIAVSDERSVAAGYNKVLDHDVPEDAEAVVFIHPDCEILDPAFRAKVVEAVSLPDTGIVGVIGASGVRDLNWWEGREKRGRVHHLEGHGGVYFERGPAEVDVVDGQVIVMSPWAVEHLRFDEGYAEPGTFCAHAHDVDVCFRALEAGRVNRVLDTEVRHHTTGGYGNKAAFDKCNARFVELWGPMIVRRIMRRQA